MAKVGAILSIWAALRRTAALADRGLNLGAIFAHLEGSQPPLASHRAATGERGRPSRA